MDRFFACFFLFLLFCKSIFVLVSGFIVCVWGNDILLIALRFSAGRPTRLQSSMKPYVNGATNKENERKKKTKQIWTNDEIGFHYD